MKRLSIATLLVLFAFAGHAQINKGESFIGGSILSVSQSPSIFSNGFDGIFQLSPEYVYAIKDNRLLTLGASFRAQAGERPVYSIEPSYEWLFPINEKLFWQVGVFGRMQFSNGGDSNLDQVYLGVSLPGLGYRLHDRIVLNLYTGSLSYEFKNEFFQLSGRMSGLSFGALVRLGKKREE
jgi:hypothetical protein